MKINKNNKIVVKKMKYNNGEVISVSSKSFLDDAWVFVNGVNLCTWLK